MIARGKVVWLGLAQLVSWGVSYYLVGGFGDAIAADLMWTRGVVYGGFSVALLVMGLASPIIGRLIDRHGGRRVMVVGSLFNAAGCTGVALCHSVALYYASWVVLGVAMRLTLYEAAFAALARIAGAGARRAMAQITLLGGLASTVFWPLGHLIAAHAGWRGALLAYAGFALLTVPLHLTIPDDRHDHEAPVASPVAVVAPRATERRDVVLASVLYAVLAALAAFLNAGMSSQMISILTGLGVVASTSVWIATLRGIGQSAGRLSEVLFGRRFDPMVLTLATTAVMPLCFVAGLFGGRSALAALGFALFYGVTNGVLTITRGTMPLVLFDPRTYGAFVGRLLVPSFVLSAAAPVMYAAVLRRFGEAGELGLSIVASCLSLGCAVLLWIRFRRPRAAP